MTLVILVSLKAMETNKVAGEFSCNPFRSDSVVTACLHSSTTGGYVFTEVCLLTGGGGYLLGRGGGATLDKGGTYLGWGREYLLWMGQGEGVPTLDGGRSTYLGLGEGVPTLDGRRGSTYLLWWNLDGGRGTYLGQVTPWAVHLLQLPAGGFSCFQ